MIETLIPVPGRLKPYETGTPLANAADIRNETRQEKVLETLDYINDRAINSYGPYSSVSEAHLALSQKGFNTIGTTVGIIENNQSVVEYWYESGTQQTNLVKKNYEQPNYYIKDVVWPYGGDTLYKDDDEELIPIVTAQQILTAANGVTLLQIDVLLQQINELSARLTGVTINVVPTTATVGQQSEFDIVVASSVSALGVVIYRNNVQIDSSDTVGTSWSFVDTYTPQNAEVLKYKAVVEVSEGVYKENEFGVAVNKQNAGIGWSYNNATVYTGYSGNQFPTLSNPNNLTITYESSNTSVAIVNSSGVVTLEGAGNAEIRAIFMGNNTYNASTVRYSLNVVQDAVNSLAWSGQSLSPSTLLPNGTATLTKGTVIATYLSGKTEDVSSLSIVSAQRGVISGTTYTAPATTGNDVISVMYAGVTSATKINVIVQEESKLNVYFGHGATYANATFTNTGEALYNNMSVTTDRNAGDYLFIKVDKRDTVNNLYLHNEGGGIFEYMEIALNAAVTDGDYKYYQSTSQYNAGTGIKYVINKV